MDTLSLSGKHWAGLLRIIAAITLLVAALALLAATFGTAKEAAPEGARVLMYHQTD